MTSQRRTLSYRLVLAFSASLAASLLTTGCGIGTVATGSSESLVAGAMGGQLKGGPNPISGATITVWTTGTSYGTGVSRQTTTSGADGSFNFAGGYTCPSGQFLYLSSAGGNTGAGTNNLAVLVAALGRCDDLYSGGKYTGPFIYMNELTTVAAAYALNGFATTSGNGSTAAINIGAPSTNNAATGTTTASAGLRHAFLNAANLVNVNAYSTSANSNPPGNTAAIVPKQLINSIANSLVACVNTAGSGSSSCSTVFGATGTSTSTGNTFLAMLNLARNPSLAGNTSSPTNFLSAASPATNFYQPVLTTAPTDFSIAIQYPKGLGAAAGTQGLQYPILGALDANDNFYVGNNDAASPTKFNLVSFSSNGTVVTFTPDAASNAQVLGVSTDAIGHLYRADGPNTTLYRYNVDDTVGTINPTPANAIFTSTGAVAFTAVDRRNNVWAVASNIPYFGEVVAGTSTLGNVYQITNPGGQIAVDANQNIWVANSNTASISGNVVTVLENTGSAATPAYPGTIVTSPSLSGESNDGIAFLSNGTGYITNQTSTGGITPVVPTQSGATVTALTPGSQTVNNFSTPNSVRSDGRGVLWISDSSGSSLLSYLPNATFATAYASCIPASNTTNTTCTTSSSGNDLQIDSTGSIWVTHASTGSLSQVIGAAAPTVPLLSLGKFGILP